MNDTFLTLRKDSSTFTGHSLWGDIDWTLTKYSDYIHVRVELSKNYIHFTFGKHSANFQDLIIFNGGIQAQACMFVCPSVQLSNHQSVCLSICPAVHLSVCLSIYFSFCPSVHLFVFLSVCQPFFLQNLRSQSLLKYLYT